MKKHEKEFDELAEEILERAEKIECTSREFYDGLRGIRAAIDNRILLEREENI